MSESPVVPMDIHDKDIDAKVFRTSTQARMNSASSPLLLGFQRGAEQCQSFGLASLWSCLPRCLARLQELDHRISNLTRVPVSHNEEVQVLRYRTGEFYAAHNDNFDPAFYQTSVESWLAYFGTLCIPQSLALLNFAELCRSGRWRWLVDICMFCCPEDYIDKGHRNRLLTVFWYLTNVSKGGETNFPRANALPQPEDNRESLCCLSAFPPTQAVQDCIYNIMIQ